MAVWVIKIDRPDESMIDGPEDLNVVGIEVLMGDVERFDRFHFERKMLRPVRV